VFIVVVFFLAALQQVNFARKYHEWSENQYVYPSHPVIAFLQKNAGFDRVIGIGSAHITSNIPEFFGLYSAEGIAPNYPLTYALFTQAALSGPAGMGNVGRVEVRIAPTQKNIFVEKNPVLLRLLAITGTRYIVVWDGDEDSVPDKEIDPSLFRLVMHEGLWRIFEYTQALPRAFLTADYEVAEDNTQVLSAVFDPAHPASRVILRVSPRVPEDPDASGTAVIQKITANTVVIDTQSEKQALLFLSDTYWPDFIGFVDEEKVPVLEADFAYRAVAVPAGRHTVVFTYDTGKERMTYVIAGLVWLGACWLWLWKKNDTI
jgi:hypothetical protein